MLAVTKEQITTGFVDLHATVPERFADRVKAAFESVLAVLSDIEDDDNAIVTWECKASPGQLLRGARNREGLSQDALAKMVGISRPNVSDMEHGRRTITQDMAAKLGKALGTSASNFLA